MSVLDKSKEELLETIRRGSRYNAMGNFPVMGSLSDSNKTSAKHKPKFSPDQHKILEAAKERGRDDDTYNDPFFN